MKLQSKNSLLKQTCGFLMVHKKPGYTSHQVVNGIRKLFNTRKVGHGGTLDPLAEGLLIVGIGKATKYLSCLLNETKEYQTTCQLGLTTNSQDISGKPIETNCFDHITIEKIQKKLQLFQGHIEQIPPMFSAQKVKGQKLYKYARKGVQIERSPKKVQIFKCELLKVSLPFISLSIHCSKGTYIRTLCHDLGESLKTGACMNYLIRNRIGSFSLKQAHTIDQMAQMTDENKFNSLLPLSSIRKIYENNS